MTTNSIISPSCTNNSGVGDSSRFDVLKDYEHLLDFYRDNPVPNSSLYPVIQQFLPSVKPKNGFSFSDSKFTKNQSKRLRKKSKK
jgi:hypothetical protein